MVISNHFSKKGLAHRPTETTILIRGGFVVPTGLLSLLRREKKTATESSEKKNAHPKKDIVGPWSQLVGALENSQMISTFKLIC